MRFSRRSRVAALFLVAPAVAWAATACSSGGGTGSGGPPSPQQLFNVRLVSDVKSLDRGVLLYQVPGTLNTGAQAYLQVEVADIGRTGNELSSRPPGWVLYPQDVPTGGVVGLTATCDGLQCNAQSQPRQAVPSAGSAARWYWVVAARNPGVSHIYLDATTYEENSDVVLYQTDPPIEITVSVTATPVYWLSRVDNWLKAVVGFIGFATLLTLAAGIRRWRAKRKKRALDPEQGKTPVHASPAPGDTPTSHVEEMCAGRVVSATAVELPLTSGTVSSAAPGTDASDGLSQDPAAAALLSAGVTDGRTGQTLPAAVDLDERMPHRKTTRTPDNLNPLDNACYLRTLFIHFTVVALFWAPGTFVLLGIGAILALIGEPTFFFLALLLTFVWSIVPACMFWLRKLPSQVAECNFLIDDKSGLAPQVFEHVARAFNRRGVPVDSWGVRRIPMKGEHPREVLEVRKGIFHGMVSCFPCGNDLYIGWTFWLHLSPARWLLLWLRRFFWWRHRRDHLIRQILQFDNVRALREALHGAAQEGMDLASGQLAITSTAARV